MLFTLGDFLNTPVRPMYEIGNSSLIWLQYDFTKACLLTLYPKLKIVM